MGKIVKIKSISKNTAVELVHGSKGRIMTISYTKNNGQPRTQNCVRAAQQLQANLGYITVYDMKEKEFKNIAAARISKLTTNGVTYKVAPSKVK